MRFAVRVSGRKGAFEMTSRRKTGDLRRNVPEAKAAVLTLADIINDLDFPGNDDLDDDGLLGPPVEISCHDMEREAFKSCRHGADNRVAVSILCVNSINSIHIPSRVRLQPAV